MREMRKNKRLLTDDKVVSILETGLYGVLSLVDENGPYGVPLSYVHFDGNIYFHGARVGHKLDCIKFNNQASFCVVIDVETRPAKFTTKYKSVIAFGKVYIIENEEERHLAFRTLIEKYSPGFISEGEDYMRKGSNGATIFKLSVDQVMGKGIE